MSRIEQVVSPLTYLQSVPGRPTVMGKDRRLQLVDLTAGPTSEFYFGEHHKTERYGRSGKLLVKPRTIITPGADEGVIAFLDYQLYEDYGLHVRIDYMLTREERRAEGCAKALVDYLYTMHRDARVIDWGDIHHDAALRLWQSYREAGNVPTTGRNRCW